jgi:hypothetical protein
LGGKPKEIVWILFGFAGFGCGCNMTLREALLGSDSLEPEAAFTRR